jgi:hypothetical protein
VVPPAGAVLDVRGTRPYDDSGTVRFQVGPVRYDLEVSPRGGDPADAARRLRRKLCGPDPCTPVGPERVLRTDAGSPGRGGTIRVADGPIPYAAFVVGGRTVEVTATGPPDALAQRWPDIEASLRTLRAAR